MKLEHLDINNFSSFIENEKNVIVDFWAVWCGPCRMVAPELEKLVNNNIISVGKVDCDANEELAAKYGVESIPTMLLFKDAKLVNKIVGYHTYEDLVEFINNN